MKNKGFTLIELLIVIALLGILAVAALSAINPIEQINRSRDTATRSDTEQLINASDRYYAVKGYFPWMNSGQSSLAVDPLVEITTITQEFGDDSEEVLTNLSSGGNAELKESYVSRIIATNANHLYLYNHGEQGDSTYVCFVPKSAAFREEAWGRCDPAAPNHNDFGDLPSDYPVGACPTTDCVGVTDATDAKACFICLP